MLPPARPITDCSDIMHARFLSSTVDKRSFASSKVVLAISVGQDAHEGEKLFSTIKLINKSFSHCDIAVCDSLQRHTMAITEIADADQITLKARMLGQEWIQRNKSTLDLLKIPHTIFRWDAYLSDPDFQRGKDELMHAYHTDAAFRNSALMSIQEFTERHRHRFTVSAPNQTHDACLNYLIEESAVIAFTWAKYHYNYIIYPSRILAMVQATLDKFVSPIYPGFLQWLRLRIRTRAIYKTIPSRQNNLLQDRRTSAPLGCGEVI